MGCSCCKNCNKNGCSCCCCKNSKGETKHEAELRELIHYGRVVIFSKTVCPFCDDAKKMFRLMNSDYAAMELDDLSPNHGLIKALKAKTGYTTVPQVFIDGRFVGGLCDLKALKNSGELQKLLCQVNPACITTKSMRTNTGCSPIYPKTDEGPCRNNCSAVTSTKRIRKKADRCQDPYEVLGKMGNRYPPGCKGCCCCKCKDKYQSRFKRELDGHIQSQRVVMFGKPGCNYCAEVRRIFASIGIAVKTIELDVYAPTDGLVLELMKRTGYTTVPQIFVDNEFIGGLVELKELYACGAIQDRLCRADVVYTKPERWKMKDFGYIRANQTQGREAKVDDEFSSSDDTEQSSDSDKQKK